MSHHGQLQALGLSQRQGRCFMSKALTECVCDKIVCLSGKGSGLKLCDFGLAEIAAELAEQQADRANLIGHAPTGGFHKRHMVRTQLLSTNIGCKAHDAASSHK